jgi:hypothetical protein
MRFSEGSFAEAIQVVWENGGAEFAGIMRGATS